MGYIFMIVAGAVLGWLTAFVLQAERPRVIKINIAAGIAGALLAGLVIEPALAGGNLAGGIYTVEALLATVLGAVAFIMMATVLREQEML